MKSFLPLAALLLASQCVFAGKASYEHDTVYSDGHPYCIMHKTGGITHTFSVRNLHDEELIIIRFVNRYDNNNQNVGSYIATFLNDNREGELGNDINLAKKLMREIVANDLVKDGAINPSGERRFLILYPKQRDQGVNVNVFGNNNNPYNSSIANRDRSAPVTIVGKRIFQDKKFIGDYTERSRAGEGTIYTIQSFLDIRGEVAAEATFYGVNETGCKLFTKRDSVTRIINLKSTFGPEQAIEVAAWLSAQGYL